MRSFSDFLTVLSLVRGYVDVANYADKDYLDEAASALEAAQSVVLRV